MSKREFLKLEQNKTIHWVILFLCFLCYISAIFTIFTDSQIENVNIPLTIIMNIIVILAILIVEFYQISSYALLVFIYSIIDLVVIRSELHKPFYFYSGYIILAISSFLAFIFLLQFNHRYKEYARNILNEKLL